jgi:hypothetical protein
MDQTAIEDLNRKLAELTAPLWFTATVREIQPDQEDTPPGEGEILFQAVTWRGNQRLEHTAAYPVGDVESSSRQSERSARLHGGRSVALCARLCRRLC